MKARAEVARDEAREATVARMQALERLKCEQ